MFITIERAKFMFYKLFPNFLVRRDVDLYAAAWKNKFSFFKLFSTSRRGTLRRCIDIFQLSGTSKHRSLRCYLGMLRRRVEPYAAA